MIARIWRGWTAPGDADAYEALLKTEIFPSIRQRGIAGLADIELLRREDNERIEFLTILRFDSLDSVGQFAGPQPELAFVPPPARALLDQFEEYALHYEVRSGE